MFLKPAIKNQIIWQRHISSNILIADFQYHNFSAKQTFYENNFLRTCK